MNEVLDTTFRFKKFSLEQQECTMKIGTDGILLGAWVSIEGAKSILDVGTGTGLIAIMCAQRNDKANIHGVEIDEASYNLASQNASNAPWADRISMYHNSVQEFVGSHAQKFDLIISNPPFFSGGTFSDKERRTSMRHTVKLSHGDLLRSVNNLLTLEGKFAVILPYIEGLRFVELAEQSKLYAERITKVFPRSDKRVERLLIEFVRTKPTGIKENTLIIRNENNEDVSQDFKALTKDFYL